MTQQTARCRYLPSPLSDGRGAARPVITWRVLGGRRDLCVLFALTAKKAHVVCEVREPKGSPGQSTSERNTQLMAEGHGPEPFRTPETLPALTAGGANTASAGGSAPQTDPAGKGAQVYMWGIHMLARSWDCW